MCNHSQIINGNMVKAAFKVIGSIFLLPASSAFLSPLGRHHALHGHHDVMARNYVGLEHGVGVPTTNLHLFRNIVNDDNPAVQEGLQEKELARFSNLLAGSSGGEFDNKIDVKFDSLSMMISSWSKMFSDHKSMGLTTPVDVVELPTTDDSAGVQLLFKKGFGGRSAYYDKDDDDDGGDNKKKKKEDSIKEGGVQVRIEKLSSGNDLEVIASRCDIEDGTMIKEMSEQTIIDSLRKTMQAWKKEQQ